MDIRNQHVSTENFWEMYSQFEQDTYKTLRSENKLKNAYYLARHLLIRLFACLIVIPSSLAFMLFILSSYDFGMVEMANSILTGNEPMTANDVGMLAQTWLFLGGLILMMSWPLWTWKSPARRETDLQLNLWWYEHGDKLPVARLRQSLDHAVTPQGDRQ